MAFTKLVALALPSLFSLLTIVVRADYVIHEQRDELGRRGAVRNRVQPDTLLPMRIALQPNKHASSTAEDWIMAVADPDSPSFGEFWDQNEVIEAFKPAHETLDAVKRWLRSHGIEEVTHSDNKQWLAFDLPASQAEALLNTKYFATVAANGKVEVSCDSYMLPKELQSHVDYIKPGVKSGEISERSSRRRRAISRHLKSKRDSSPGNKFKNPNSLKDCDHVTTPACIRALYDFSAPDPNERICPNNSMGIFEEGDLYYQGDLDKFYQALTDIPNGTTPLDVTVDGGQRPPTSPRATGWGRVDGESNLDLQSALPIIYPQNATIYQVDDRYYSHAVSYGEHHLELWNDFLDAIDGSYCTYSAYGETGNDPKFDPTYPDTSHKHGYKGKLQCGVFKPTNVISISYGGSEFGPPYFYQKRQCNEWLKLALQGVSVFVASGDWGSSCFGRTHDHPSNVFVPDVLVGCPWITAVGGTQVGKGKTVYDPEEAGAAGDWRSGGGFSIIYDAPAYQKSSISRYFSVSHNASDLPYFYNGKYKGNDGVYNRNGRGFPDISATMTHIAFFFRTRYQTAVGTSASAPIVAALFNRIIEERIRAGKRGRIGLVNPTLYKNPQALNDITIGNNGVYLGPGRLRDGSEYGYNCTEGWDPVTGLGTPKYPEMLKVFMDLP